MKQCNITHFMWYELTYFMFQKNTMSMFTWKTIYINIFFPVPQRRRVAVGFTAYWGEHTVISVNSVIIFTDVLCNEGGCYSTSTGEFTAPYNGLYLASLTLRQRDEGRVNAHVRANKPRFFAAGGEDTVCKVLTHADKTSGCDIGVVRLKAGDKLFVRIMEAESKPRLSFHSGFSCVLIG